MAFAGPVKTYQVTGPVLEVTSDMVAVHKGRDRWEIAIGPDTKVTGELKWPPRWTSRNRPEPKRPRKRSKQEKPAGNYLTSAEKGRQP